MVVCGRRGFARKVSFLVTYKALADVMILGAMSLVFLSVGPPPWAVEWNGTAVFIYDLSSSFFEWSLNLSIVPVFLSDKGKLFHNIGAAFLNEQSPIVFFFSLLLTENSVAIIIISHSYTARQVYCMSTTRVEETLWRSLYLLFHFLPRFIEDNEGWINKRKCKPKKTIEPTLSPNAFVCT